jgi:hypothetical protein
MAEPWMDERAIEFAKRYGFVLDLSRKLGYGTDGIVWRTNRNTAIKAFERRATYETEKRCYLRLQERHVTEILGFTVPQLEGFDDELLIVEMTIVFPPFLLDFGKAYIDKKPDYSEEVMAEDEEFRQELFEDNWPTVELVLSRLESLGIYYVDARPGNITFR